MNTGWETRPLGDVCEFQRGLTYSKGDEVDVSANVVLRAMNIDLSSHLLDFSELKYISDQVVVPASKKVKKDSLMICTASGSKSHLGKVAFIDDDYGYAFGGFMGLLTPSADLLPKYLFHLMTSGTYEDFIGALAAGMNINNLKFEDLKQFQVPFPPIPEQRRIVGILDEAFAAIATAHANAEWNLRNAREVFETKLDLTFSRRDAGWVERRLGDVCWIPSKLVDPRLDGYIALTHVGAGNIESDTGKLWQLQTAGDEGLISGKFLFDETVVLYSKIRPYLRKVARPDFKGLCSADMYPLAPKHGEITRHYLYYMLLSRPFTEYAMQGSARAGMPKVNRDHLFEYRLWLPAVEQQAKDAAVLDLLADDTARLASIYQHKLAALDALKQSLLHQAFAGAL